MTEKTQAASPEAVVQPKPPNLCFGCGKANASGMQLDFTRDETTKKVSGDFVLDARYQGAPGIAHGGIVATVLDEALSKVSRFYGVSAVTASLNVEYLKPVRIGQPIHVEAWLERSQGRQFYYVGEIRGADGKVLARANGRFVAVDVQKLLRGGGFEPVNSKENGQ
ncbi:MAG TPA: PaaI family thioesterase [Candidatus Acidoferrales bacterium]|nr:PaaI family thioesterase [Candidatus Acidoferrales bacterium]